MAATPLILAKNLREAHDFARETLGLSRGQYRIATSPSSISGRRGVDLYLVPGYLQRHDRFSWRGAIRYTRLNVIDVAAQAELFEHFASQEVTRARARAESEIADQLTLLSDDVTESLTSNGDNMIAEGSPIEPSVRRRRRRCKECGVLVEPDDVERHAADHFPSEV